MPLFPRPGDPGTGAFLLAELDASHLSNCWAGKIAAASLGMRQKAEVAWWACYQAPAGQHVLLTPQSCRDGGSGWRRLLSRVCVGGNLMLRSRKGRDSRLAGDRDDSGAPELIWRAKAVLL